MTAPISPMAKMTPEEFDYCLGELNLTRAEASALLGAHDQRTTGRWAHGKRTVPNTAAMLLRLMVLGVLDPSDLPRAFKAVSRRPGPSRPRSIASA